MKVLFDRSVVSAARVLEGAVQVRQIQLGQSTSTIELHGYTRKTPPPPNHIWKADQIDCLPTVAKLVREGIVSAYTYQELEFEGWRATGFTRDPIADVFADLDFEIVEAAIERSYFSQSALIQETVSKRRLVDFCRFLIEVDEKEFVRQLRGHSRFPDSVLDMFLRINEYRDICKGKPDHMYPDAFHYWTAEVNSLEYFLTLDKSFIRAICQSSKLETSCKPICPSDLLLEAGVTEREPMPYKMGTFINAFGQET